jgi:Tol biopolymer transport system component
VELNGARPTTKTPVKLIASTRIDHEARYSPDGKRITFSSNRSGSWEIWVSNSDGSNVAQLTSFGGSYYTTGPRWSPNGQDIYFNSNVDGKLSPYVIRAEGGQATHFIEDVDGWSRDGKWIYFDSKRSGENQLWKRPVDGGGNAVQVTRKGNDGDAVEATDGKFVYYLKGGGAWRVPIQGGEETQVLESVFNNNFAVVDQGIYFIPSSERPSIQFLSFATRKIVIIARIGEQEPDYGLPFPPDGRWLLYAQYESVRSELKLVQNFR